MATYEILLAIRAQDPDGKETEPTDADYKRFEQWVVANFGEEALREYRGNWAETEGSNA